MMYLLNIVHYYASKKLIGLLLISLITLCLKAQTYELPDINFRNKLIANYPGFMTDDGLLNTVAAANHYGELTLNNAGIENLSGIEYFVNLNTLNAVNNDINSINEISNLTRLVNLYLTNNKISGLPSLENLVNLYDLQITGNEITSLPNMNNLTNLANLYCGDNLLSSPPDLSSLTALEILVLSGNNIEQSPDLSNLMLLKEIHLDRTGITKIIGLEALTNLRKLYAWGNELTQIDDLESNTSLEILVVSDNKLKDLPTLNNKPNLNNVVISNNHLTIEKLLPITTHPNFGDFIYIPQAPISLNSGSVRETNSFTFTVNINESLNNVYEWYKKDVLVYTTESKSFTLENISRDNEGKYSVHVWNPSLADLVLVSNEANLNVLPCIEFNSFDVTETNITCERGSDISLNFNINGGTRPFYYQLKNNNLTLNNNEGVFQGIPAGVYYATLTDDKGCEIEKQRIIIDQKNDCQAIFSPDGDGIMDTYFINEQGTIQIIDKGRTVIKTLQGPTIWDGSTDQGGMASAGYYAIVINNSKVINITLVR